MTATIVNPEIPILRRMYLVDNHSELIIKISTLRCEDSFKKIFSHYSKRLYSYGMKNQLTESLASDLVQEVMTRVWTKSSYYNASKGSVDAWIFTIARNIRFDLLRKANRDSCVISSDDIWNPVAPLILVDQDADQVELLSHKNLRVFVEKLPPHQRDVITEVYFNGLTQEEYCSKMSLPLGTVKSRIRLAIRRLNELLERK